MSTVATIRLCHLVCVFTNDIGVYSGKGSHSS